MSLQRIKRPITRRGKRFLLAREPKLIETAKNTLFIEGRKCTGDAKATLKDFYHLKKPLCKVLTGNNDITPFENTAPLENLARKNDCHLFLFGSNSKKRPNNLIIGRLFENELLDMVELGIKSYMGLQDFKNDKIGTCVKPCLVFNGPKWKQNEDLRRLKSLFLDMFHRETIAAVRLQGIEHVISFTVTEDCSIHMRSYKIFLKKSGVRVPRIELSEIGPSVDFAIRRTKIASEDLYKLARKQPKQLRVTKKKNVTRDGLGNVKGRVHLGRQNILRLQTRKMKGLKKTTDEKKLDRKKKKTAARAAAAQ